MSRATLPRPDEIANKVFEYRESIVEVNPEQTELADQTNSDIQNKLEDLDRILYSESIVEANPEQNQLADQTNSDIQNKLENLKIYYESIVEANPEQNQLADQTNSDIQNKLENLDKIYVSKLSNLKPEQKNDVNELPNFTTKKINDLSKVSPSKSKRILDLEREIRFETEKIQRLVTLFTPKDLTEFEVTLMWMSENGSEGELEALRKIAKNPPYDFPLLDYVIQKISIRLAERYIIFDCSESAARNFSPQIKVIRSYQNFVIVSTDPEVILNVKQRYPVGCLPSPKTLEDNSDPQTNPSEKTMRDQVIQFNAPILDDWKRQIVDIGAEILRPIGNLQIVVSVSNPEIIEQIKKSVEGVEAITPYVPKIRVQPQNLQNLRQDIPPNATEEDLKKAIATAQLKAAQSPPSFRTKSTTLPGILIADFFTEDDRNQAAHTLEAQKISIVDRPGKTLLVIDVSKDPNALESFKTISHLTGLQSLEEKTIHRLFNEQARYIIGKNVIPANPHPLPTDLSLTGKGEIIAIADTGLDTGDIATIHPDFRGRVLKISSYPIQLSLSPFVHNPNDDHGASDKYSSHGTHVAGSALGDGTQARRMELSCIPAGMATEAQLIFQALEQTPKWTLEFQSDYYKVHKNLPPSSCLCGIPDDLQTLFQRVYDYDPKARIHSNSWGGGEPGDYNLQSEQLDRFVWEHKDFLVIVAAGNEGKQSFSESGIDPGSVASPGTAKNCLTVGASENDRNDQFSVTYGHLFPNQFPEPIKSDRIADSINDIAAFSGRGPCQDGRRKPDVIAPGTFILSTRSSRMPENDFDGKVYPHAPWHYMYEHGSSMATPLVAGCAALVRQYLKDTENLIKPSAALVKAILIHSAQYIDYRFKHPFSKKWSDNEQGWGRVNLSQVLNPPSPIQVQFIDESKGLKTDEFHEYPITISDTTVPLKVTLVYSDYPGDTLINNLNLILSSPDGKKYLGNDFEAIGDTDSLNNVEGIVIESPELGKWTIKVIGTSVPQAPQDYALVISGGLKR